MCPINLIKGAKQMKAVVMHEYGGPDILKYEDAPDPVPGKGEVLIRIAAASINPVDLWQRARSGSRGQAGAAARGPLLPH